MRIVGFTKRDFSRTLFVESIGDEYDWTVDDWNGVRFVTVGGISNEIEAGLLCRTPEYMKKLINDIGGESEMVVNNQCKIGKVTGCHVFHVRKRN